MKKEFLKYYVLGLVCFCAILTFLYLQKSSHDDSDATLNSNTKFKDEYTAYNGKENNGRNYPQVDISDDNVYYYASEDEIRSLFEDKKTGVLYLGFPTCPWCRNMVPVLNEAGKYYGIDKIYYYNIKEIRSSYSFDSDNKLVKQEGTKLYNYLLAKLDSFLADYSVTDNNNKSVKTGEKRIYAPTVVFIKEGEVKGIVEGTVDSQKDPYILLDETQRKELYDKYLEYFNKLAEVCDEKC
ncbi:MAG: hypothetical protein PUD34_04435 [bacterium]|nr:hypothetical protein [bacterium]